MHTCVSTEQFLKLSVGLSLGLGSGFCVFYCFSFDHFMLLLFGFVALNLVGLARKNV